MISYELRIVDATGVFGRPPEERKWCPTPQEIHQRLVEVYGAASGGGLQLVLSNPPFIPAQLSGTGPSKAVGEAELRRLLMKNGLNKNGVGALYIFFVEDMLGVPSSARGYMYDQVSSSTPDLQRGVNAYPREAAGVLVHRVKAQASGAATRLLGGATDQNLSAVCREMLLRTVCHEFGHMLNLGHVNTAPPTALTPSITAELAAAATPAPFATFSASGKVLCSGQASLVKMAYSTPASAPWDHAIRPGGRDFAGGYDCSGRLVNSAASDAEPEPGLSIRLASDRPYLVGEPVILEVTLHSPEAVSREWGYLIEPGSSFATFWIRTPAGELRIFRPYRFICADPPQENDAESLTHTLRHNPRVYWGAKGPVFTEVGEYALWAEACVAGRSYRSNEVQIGIQAPQTGADQELGRLLLRPEVAVYLLSPGTRSVPARARQRLEQLLTDDANQPLRSRSSRIPYLAYTLAKRQLEPIVAGPTHLPATQILSVLGGKKISNAGVKRIEFARDLINDVVLPWFPKGSRAPASPLGTHAALGAARIGELSARLLSDKRQAAKWEKLQKRLNDLE